MENKLTPGKPMELPEMDMHAAVEVAITVRMKLPSGETGALTAYAEPGRLPTRAQQMGIVAGLLDPASLAAAGAPPGTRAMTKPEFVGYLTKREAGQVIPMPGNQEYVPASCEIPRQLLVHAIMGANFPTLAIAQEYEERGLAKYTGNQHNYSWEWNADLLMAMPDTMLLAMYQRITAPAEGAE